MDSDKTKVVSIMSFNSVMEAQLYKALLESAGVTARLQNDIATQIYPPIGMLLPVNILVAEADQVKAREILGAKFDLDDFHRQSNPKKAAKKPTTKKAAAEKPSAKNASKTAAKSVEKTNAKTAAPKTRSSKAAAPKTASVKGGVKAKPAGAKKTTSKKPD